MTIDIEDINDYRITYYQSEEEWLDDRHGCGATDAYKILGTCPASWGGPWTVWAKHHYPGWEAAEGTSVMRAGLVWERYALLWYDETRIEAGDIQAGSPHLHLDVQTCRIEAEVPGLPLRPSPDALIWDNDRIVGGVEVKCPRYGWDDYAKDGVIIDQWQTAEQIDMPSKSGWLGRWRHEYPCPLQYVVQVYLTMAALRSVGHEVQYWDLLVCFGPHDTRVITFMWDEAMAHRVLDLVKDAWQDIVVLGNEPPPDESRQAWDYLLARPRRKRPVTLDRTTEPQLAEDVMEYVRGHQQDSAWQKTKKALRVGILDACTQRGTEALEVQVLDQVYRVKVTQTGRFYPKLITTKGEK